MRYEWSEGGHRWGADSKLGAILDGEAVDPQACDSWPDEILRLAGRVQEARERIRLELLAEAEATPPALYDPLAERLHDFGLLEGGDRLEATTLIRERLAEALRDFARRLKPKP